MARAVVPVMSDSVQPRAARQGGAGGRGKTRKLDGPYGASFTGEGVKGLRFERRWTRPGVHPYDEISWELRTASIADESGKIVFEQKDVEVPSFWSQLATNVVVSKYFRGHIGTPERESSRSGSSSTGSSTRSPPGARRRRYFATDEDLATFKAELTHLLVHQKMSFNSPVWFNVGVEPKPQCSGLLHQLGRGHMELDHGPRQDRGHALQVRLGRGLQPLAPSARAGSACPAAAWPAGPVSFMKGYDAFAGVIKIGRQDPARGEDGHPRRRPPRRRRLHRLEAR